MVLALFRGGGAVQTIHSHRKSYPDAVVKLFYESRQTFTTLDNGLRNTIVRSDRDSAFEAQATPAVLRACKEYREQMRSCENELLDLCDILEAGGAVHSTMNQDASSLEDLKSIADILRVGENAMWLCQLMFVEKKSFLLGKSFAEWANDYGTIINAESSLENAVEWEKLIALLLQGKLSEARQLLNDVLFPDEVRSNMDVRWAAEALSNLITSVPHLYASYGQDHGNGGPIQRTFNSEWETWKIKVQHARNGLQDHAHGLGGGAAQKVGMALDILDGKEEALEQCSGGRSAPFTWIAAKLRWSQPMADVEMFVQITNEVLRKSGTAFLFKKIMDIHNPMHLVAAMKDLDVGLMKQPFHFPWLVAHLVDLLTRQFQYRNTMEMFSPNLRGAGSSSSPAVYAFVDKTGFNQGDLPYGETLREHYLYAYAETLTQGKGGGFGSDAFHDIAADYLKYLPCQIKGKQPTLNSAFSRAELGSDRAARKLLAACNRASANDEFAMVPTKEAICVTRAAHWQSCGRFGQSIQWATESGNQEFISRGCRSLVQNCLVTHDFSALDAVVDNIDGEQNMSAPIVFLTRYKELDLLLRAINEGKRLMMDGMPVDEDEIFAKGVQAGARIAKIFANSLKLDKTVWLQLLSVARSMLDESPPVIGVEDTFSLMRSLEWFEASHRKEQYVDEELPSWEITKAHLDASLRKLNVGYPLSLEVYAGLQTLLKFLPNWAVTDSYEYPLITEDALQGAYEAQMSMRNNYREEVMELLQDTRLALTKNLANAMVHPPQIP